MTVLLLTVQKFDFSICHLRYLNSMGNLLAYICSALYLNIVDKELYACKTAVDDFKTILDTVGSEQECLRAKELMQKVTVVDDQPSSRALSMKTSAKIKERGKVN